AGQYVNGDASEWALRSYFGRVNYSYLDKYLLEANFRYDGSSRLSPTGRWGLFPSVSGGWLMSKENFMKNVSWLSELKLRGSYGELGNQLIGDYPYQSLFSIVSYPFSSLEQGAQQNALVDPNIKWEKTKVLDFGTDIDIRNGLFTATIDWYRKVTNGILARLSVPSDLGLSGPVTNYGSMQNVGWEFNIGHNNSIGKNFHYGLNVIFSFYKNKVLKLSGGTQDEGLYLNKVGIPYHSFYMIQWDGIFQDTAEIDKSPKQPFTPKPGDLKYKDVNGDGVINANDRVVTTGAFPEFTYSFNLNLSYKNWSLTAFFQGMEGGKSYVNGWGIDPFLQASPPPTYFKNAWTPQNHSETIPALYVQGYAPVDGTNSTY
ncbi:MAG: SusC/RagA family TonB-linked outer membrane protein, partial [Chitinophagaceae bacterium]